MVQRVLAVLLVSSLTVGFAWGGRDEEKATEEVSEAKSAVGSGYSDAKSKTQQAVGSAKSAASPASKAPVRAATPAPANQEFPTELLGQLASGDEETRRARMESLKRLSQALSQMNERSEAAAGGTAPRAS